MVDHGYCRGGPVGSQDGQLQKREPPGSLYGSESYGGYPFRSVVNTCFATASSVSNTPVPFDATASKTG